MTDLGMVELPESVTKGDKNNSGHSLKGRLTSPFCYQREMLLECFFHSPILLLRKVTASKLII